MAFTKVRSNYIRRELAKEAVQRDPKSIYRAIKKAIEADDNSNDEKTRKLKTLLQHCQLELKKDGEVIEGTKVESMEQIDDFRREGRSPYWYLDPVEFRNFFDSEDDKKKPQQVSQPRQHSEGRSVKYAEINSSHKSEEQIQKLYERQIEQLEKHGEHLEKELRIAHANLSAEKKTNQRREKKDDRNRNELLQIIVGLQRLLPAGRGVDPSAFNAPPATDDQTSEKATNPEQAPNDTFDTQGRDDDQKSRADDSTDTRNNDAVSEKGSHAEQENDNAEEMDTSDATPTSTNESEAQPKADAEAKEIPIIDVPKKRGFFSGFFHG